MTALQHHKRNPVSPAVRQRARELRHEPTVAEQKLWILLRNRALLGAKFRRQHPIGPYIADFCDPEANLIIEVDGPSHSLSEENDSIRTAYLSDRGYRVVRFTNAEVLHNPEGVLSVIVQTLHEPPHPNPLPRGERGFDSQDSRRSHGVAL